MIKIDSKDKKILYYMLQDSRQSLKTIAKKIGASKEFVVYRVRRLFKEKIIKNYTVYLNVEKLGYIVMFLYYKFENINPIIKQEIIDFLKKSKYISYISSIEGIYDLQIDVLIGHTLEYESLMDEIQKKYHKYLKFQLATTLIRGVLYNYSFLLNEKINISSPVEDKWGRSITPIDELDFKILQILSQNPRIPTKVIANELKTTVTIVSYRIKKMIKLQIIHQYSINVDWSKLGFRYFHLRIFLRDYNKKNPILDYIRKNPFLKRTWKDLFYSGDINCTFLFRNVEKLREFIEDLTLKFPNAIDKYEFFSSYKIHKDIFMVPKLINIKKVP